MGWIMFGLGLPYPIGQPEGGTLFSGLGKSWNQSMGFYFCSSDNVCNLSKSAAVSKENEREPRFENL